MVLQTPTMTIDAFYEWIQREENIERDYEFIAGEIVPVLASPAASRLGVRLAVKVAAFIDDNDYGVVTGADGGYCMGDGIYLPTMGYVAHERYPMLSDDALFVSVAPDLAVEVVSPTDSERLLMIKVANYLYAGTVVWVVYPEDEKVDVYESDKAPVTLNKTDILNGGTVLPGFELDLSKIFK
ncbi:MAG: Uma2 family endonuclease [Aggregatilineales bacterium]